MEQNLISSSICTIASNGWCQPQNQAQRIGKKHCPRRNMNWQFCNMYFNLFYIHHIQDAYRIQNRTFAQPVCRWFSFPLSFPLLHIRSPLIFLLFYSEYLYVYFSVIFRFCLSFVFQLNLSVKTKIAKPCFGRTPQSLFPIYFMIHDGQHISFSGFRRIS